MTRIGIVITARSSFLAADPERDSTLLVTALRGRGVEADALVWHDPAVDWAAYDLLVIRSPWDYPQRPAEFDAWLDRASAATRVLNEPELVRWNMDKRYLAQLEAAGIAVVPTSYHDREESLSRALADHSPDAHVVVKPAIGAGSRHAGLFAATDPAALEQGREILAEGGTVLLQPEVPELSAGHEKAVYTIDGRLTHAIAKGGLLARGGGLRGGVYQESPQLVGVTEREREFAERVLAAVSEVTDLPTPLYGRIDLVDSAEHGLVLLEAELFEPTYNLHLVPEVVEVFAEAILARA
jgi:glutathione synthase/RimK-type ligase-like ATP-grasp enzyme